LISYAFLSYVPLFFPDVRLEILIAGLLAEKTLPSVKTLGLTRSERNTSGDGVGEAPSIVIRDTHEISISGLNVVWNIVI
jgi:hypothetical protein